MKKIFILTLIIFISFVTTGCVQNEYDVEITKKDTVNISQTKAIQKDFLSLLGTFGKDNFQTELDRSLKELNKQGYITETIDNDILLGYKATKQNLPLNKFSPKDINPAFSTRAQKPVTIDNYFLKKVYTINIRYNTADETYGMSTDSPYKNLYKENNVRPFIDAVQERLKNPYPKSKITIKIPYKVTEHNATNVISPYIYEWELYNYEGLPVGIQIKYEKFDGTTLGLILTFAVVFGLLILFVNKQKNDLGF